MPAATRAPAGGSGRRARPGTIRVAAGNCSNAERAPVRSCPGMRGATAILPRLGFANSSWIARGTKPPAMCDMAAMPNAYTSTIDTSAPIRLGDRHAVTSSGNAEAKRSARTMYQRTPAIE